MSPIGGILLANCDNDMNIDLKVAKQFLPGISKHRIIVVANMLGITVKGNS